MGNRDKVILQATRYMGLREISKERMVTGAMWKKYTGATKEEERQCIACGLVKGRDAFSHSWSMMCLPCDASDRLRYEAAEIRLRKLNEEKNNGA